MNRAGSGEQNSNARLVERNLRQRAIFLSLFAVLLLFINALPFFQPVDSKSPAVVTLRPAGKDASWQLMLTPDKAAQLQRVAHSALQATLHLAPFLPMTAVFRRNLPRFLLWPWISTARKQKI